MALKHASSKELQIVHKQLLSALKELDVEVFGAAGEVFDPYKFEALQEVPTSEASQDHTVAEVHRLGYQVGERVIRPAQVGVYAYKQS